MDLSLDIARKQPDTRIRWRKFAPGGTRQRSLRVLLQHDSAKVRTLALISLFEREDPRLLPDIATLTDDRAPTFDGHPELDPDWLHWVGVGPPKRVQTVGFVAKSILEFCQCSPIDGRPDSPWDHQEDPSISSQWMLVRMRRASWETTPVDDGIRARLRKLRGEIDALPSWHRARILVRLLRETSGELLIADPDLIRGSNVKKRQPPGK